MSSTNAWALPLHQTLPADELLFILQSLFQMSLQPPTPHTLDPLPRCSPFTHLCLMLVWSPLCLTTATSLPGLPREASLRASLGQDRPRLDAMLCISSRDGLSGHNSFWFADPSSVRLLAVCKLPSGSRSRLLSGHSNRQFLESVRTNLGKLCKPGDTALGSVKGSHPSPE